MNRKIIAAAFAATLSASPAFALDQVFSPNAEKGEKAIEYSASRTFDGDSEKDNAQEHEVAFEYGISDRIMLELAGILEREPGDDQDTKYEGTEIMGRFQFTERGEYWMDSGLLAAYHFTSRTHEPSAAEIKLLLEKDTGPLTHRANIGFEQTAGKYSRATGGPDYSFAWSTRWRYKEWLEPGFEIQSGLGQGETLRHYDEQEHYVGPAVYGKLFNHVKYEAAWLAGVSHEASDSAARFLIEYELPF